MEKCWFPYLPIGLYHTSVYVFFIMYLFYLFYIYNKYFVWYYKPDLVVVMCYKLHRKLSKNITLPSIIIYQPCVPTMLLLLIQ
jgi:hypothetical protein